LYFFRIPSLWYFQNCFEASLPATRWRTVDRYEHVRHSNATCKTATYSSYHLHNPTISINRIAALGPWSRHTWVVILELGHIVDILVHDDPKAVALVVRRDVSGLESLRHDDADEAVRSNRRRRGRGGESEGMTKAEEVETGDNGVGAEHNL
jgi:hypothetical protein